MNEFNEIINAVKKQIVIKIKDGVSQQVQDDIDFFAEEVVHDQVFCTVMSEIRLNIWIYVDQPFDGIKNQLRNKLCNQVYMDIWKQVGKHVMNHVKSWFYGSKLPFEYDEYCSSHFCMNERITNQFMMQISNQFESFHEKNHMGK